jgi:DNA-binding NtrC family response regulator
MFTQRAPKPVVIPRTITTIIPRSGMDKRLPSVILDGHALPTLPAPSVRGATTSRPLLPNSPASLAVLTLSASFSALWGELAAELGVPLRTVTSIDDFPRGSNAIRIIAAGGEEALVEPLLRARTDSGEEIAVVGALPSHRFAVSIMRAGSNEYFALPGDIDVFRSWLRERVEQSLRSEQASAFAAGERAKYTFQGILGDSPALRAALDRAARIIPRGGVTVLIQGETGTGKELLARAIHYNGPRREAPFVDINCAAIPEQLLESELFGHEKGAFTDASSAKPGLFEMAEGGTLFLDEIGHLALPLQGKLLRALEERQIRRVGGTRLTPINVRIVAATHVDLAEASRRGEFREDLYYRLNVVPLELPALRNRRTDIVPLAEHFVGRFANEYDMAPPRLTAAAQQMLKLHYWSGNVRELRNVIERAVLLCDGARIDTTDLALDTVRVGTQRSGALPFPATLSALTRAAVEEMLRLTDGNKSEAARQLAISRPRLLRLLDGDTSPDTDTEHPDHDA